MKNDSFLFENRKVETNKVKKILSKQREPSHNILPLSKINRSYFSLAVIPVRILPLFGLSGLRMVITAQ